jgi:hypothetical protein
MTVVEINNGSFFPVLEPPVAGDLAIVLVDFAVTVLPVVELAGAQAKPTQKPTHWKLRAVGPMLMELTSDRVHNNPTGATFHFQVRQDTGIHVRMDHILGAESSNLLDSEWFGRYHKMYLWTSSLQWLASLALLFLAVLRWNRHDTRKACGKSG